jgi:hypothetical protein
MPLFTHEVIFQLVPPPAPTVPAVPSELLERIPTVPEFRPRTEPWRQVLLDAADLLDEVGWCQHRASDEYGRMCAGNAIQLVARSSIAQHEAHMKLIQATGYGGVPNWNDRGGMTKERVTSTMRRVAAS